MDPTELTHTIIAIIYYILMIPLAVFSAFGIYIFIRYGKTPAFALSTSAVFIIIFLGLFTSSYHLLNSL